MVRRTRRRRVVSHTIAVRGAVPAAPAGPGRTSGGPVGRRPGAPATAPAASPGEARAAGADQGIPESDRTPRTVRGGPAPATSTCAASRPRRRVRRRFRKGGRHRPHEEKDKGRPARGTHVLECADHVRGRHQGARHRAASGHRRGVPPVRASPPGATRPGRLTAVGPPSVTRRKAPWRKSHRSILRFGRHPPTPEPITERSQKRSGRHRVDDAGRSDWCARGELNPHALSGTGT